jgi:hypothetical protein
VIDNIGHIMVPDTAGHPITGIKWSRKTRQKISLQLRRVGISVSAKTVGRLLKKLNFKLRVNRKQISRSKSPERDRQFRRIRRMRQVFERNGNPIVSVDTKKKEQIGQFKNAGAVWVQAPLDVYDHDFRKYATCMTVPFALFDPVKNRGHVVVGTSHDTAQFAVAALARWWSTDASHRYPKAKRLLILADNGGGNGSKNRLWKVELQKHFVDRFQLPVTVCHYPPGTSKWNPIEHRLFSEISKNWKGQPLNSIELMLNYIRTTKTVTGLKVRATFLPGEYPTGIRVSDAELAAVQLKPAAILPAWNYTVVPKAKCEVIFPP